MWKRSNIHDKPNKKVTSELFYSYTSSSIHAGFFYPL